MVAGLLTLHKSYIVKEKVACWVPFLADVIHYCFWEFILCLEGTLVSVCLFVCLKREQECCFLSVFVQPHHVDTSQSTNHTLLRMHTHPGNPTSNMKLDIVIRVGFESLRQTHTHTHTHTHRELSLLWISNAIITGHSVLTSRSLFVFQMSSSCPNLAVRQNTSQLHGLTRGESRLCVTACDCVCAFIVCLLVCSPPPQLYIVCFCLSAACSNNPCSVAVRVSAVHTHTHTHTHTHQWACSDSTSSSWVLFIMSERERQMEKLENVNKRTYFLSEESMHDLGVCVCVQVQSAEACFCFYDSGLSVHLWLLVSYQMPTLTQRFSVFLLHVTTSLCRNVLYCIFTRLTFDNRPMLHTNITVVLNAS